MTIGNRAATYVRMSTDGRQADSPERQLGQIDSYCASNGLQIVRRYQDLGERGWDETRPDFVRLIKDAQAGAFDIIVIDEASRLSRQSTIDFVTTVIAPLRDAGVVVHSVAQGGLQQWDSIVGLILTVINQEKSCEESASIGRRIQTLLQRRAIDGDMQTGKPVYGYRRVRDEDGRHPRLVLGPDNEVETIRFIFEAYTSKDMSLAQICRHLEKTGVLTPSGRTVWKPTTICKMLRDETYIGTYLFNRRHYGKYYRLTSEGPQASPNRGKSTAKSGGRNKKLMHQNPRADWSVLPRHHEAIVDEDIFRRVQLALVANRRRTTPVADRGNFLLSKLLVCADCGGWMCGLRGGNRRKPGYMAYRCSRNVTTGRCAANIVREDEVLASILNVLERRFLNADFLELLRARAREIDKRESSDSHRKSIVRSIADFTKKIEKARGNLALLDADMIPDVKVTIRKWEAARTSLEKSLAETDGPHNIENLEQVISEIECLLRSFQSAVLDKDNDAQRAFLRRCIERVKVRVDKIPYCRAGEFTYRLAGGEVFLRGGSVFNSIVNPDGSMPLGVSDTCINLSTTDRDGEQVNAWSCVLNLPG